MSYPGDGYKMSNYGYKSYTPEQVKEQWRESTVREAKTARLHAANRLLAERSKVNVPSVCVWGGGRKTDYIQILYS